jgi:hypothetical protein
MEFAKPRQGRFFGAGAGISGLVAERPNDSANRRFQLPGLPKRAPALKQAAPIIDPCAANDRLG